VPVQILEVTDGELFNQLRAVVGDALQLGPSGESLQPQTPLLGNLPELDSMAVLALISALEEHFQILVEDDDDMSEAFTTMDSLARYIERKRLTH